MEEKLVNILWGIVIIGLLVAGAIFLFFCIAGNKETNSYLTVGCILMAAFFSLIRQQIRQQIKKEER